MQSENMGGDTMTLWIARAGRYGERESQALDEGRAFIGWGDLGDLSEAKTRDDVLELITETYPDAKSGTAKNHAGQVFNFVNTMAVGDLFALPLKTRPAIAFGKIAGPYEYIPDNAEDSKHSRPVKWIGEPIPRSRFDQDLLYSFGSAMTVFTVSRNDAEERIKAILAGKVTPKAVSDSTAKDSEDTPFDIESFAKQ